MTIKILRTNAPPEVSYKLAATAVADAPKAPAESKAAVDLITSLSGGAYSSPGELADAVAANPACLEANMLGRKLQAAMEDKTSSPSREGALLVAARVAATAGPACEPHLAGALPVIIERASDKVKAVAEASVKAGLALMPCLSGTSGAVAVDALLEGLAFKTKWQTKEACAKYLAALCSACPEQVAERMFEVVPRLSECMNNIKEPVKAASLGAMERVMGLVGNRDIERHHPAMLRCITRPADVPEVITALSGTTFVQAIETPFLCVMCPLLTKGLRVNQSAVKRRAAVIIKNMSKLIIHPQDALPFLPGMLPEVTGMKENAADPDLRDVATEAWKQLTRIEAEAQKEKRASVDVAPADGPDEGEELCDCVFSLAYGGRILLNQTRMRLKRGRRYGLCGANGAGKSTLMKAISNGMVEGFPPPEQLRTVYVAHDMDADDSTTPVLQFIHSDKVVQAATAPSLERVTSALTEVGFTEAMLASAISSLSGGWKMKLALARAMLMKADILLLDEPTNHLDTTNVAWLEHFLTTSPEVSVMVVSHDSGFLDTVCTDIIHYESLKLVPYKGNLSQFVKQRPEAAAYYDLAASSTVFKMPAPGFLDGIRTRTQSVVKVTNASYSYPGASFQQLSGVTLRCCMASRVAVVGKNGAGKSTLIKLITGQADPDKGEVWKHPNLRLAYVAQHAFHHVEQHLDKTPAEYIWWRYEFGEDREGFETVGRKETDTEKAARLEAIAKGDRVVEELCQRRKHRRGLEYEVKYVDLDKRNNKWITREELIDMGLEKMVNNKDAAIASGSVYRPLSSVAVAAHLEDFGLEQEIAVNNHIRGLSGGQKVKLVLASAMWNNPHMLVLDEPTNYLDRESLGGLAAAINDFEGAVLMISHNAEFTKALCSETWLVENHKLTITGKPPWKKFSSKKNDSTGEMEEIEDEEMAKGMTEEEFATYLKEKAQRQTAKTDKAAEKAAKKEAKNKEKFRKRY